MHIDETKNILVVLSVPRSGTTFLCSELALYKNLRVLYEFFKPVSALNVPGFEKILLDKTLYEQPETQRVIEAHVDYMPHRTMLERHEYMHILGEREDTDRSGITFLLDRINADPVAALNRACEIIPEDICIKIHRDHTLPLLDIIRQPNVRTILLERRDHLARHVSHLKALKTGEWFNTDTSNTKVRVNLKRFQKECQEIDAWFALVRQTLAALDRPYLDLTYEDWFLPYDRTRFFNMMDDFVSRFCSSTEKRTRTEFLYQKQMNGNLHNNIDGWA